MATLVIGIGTILAVLIALLGDHVRTLSRRVRYLEHHIGVLMVAYDKAVYPKKSN